MKINPLSEAMRFVNLVRSKSDDARREKDREFQHQMHEQAESDDQLSDEKDHGETDPRQLDAAIDGFTRDLQAQANGLSAGTIGQGPGLRVVLKDSAGAVIRQFTGEEFMRLREAGSKEGHGRGKILDQKL